MAHVDRERDAERAAKREDAIGHRLRLLEAGDLPALAADLEPGERGASAGEADPGREGLREAIETGKAPAALEMVRRLIAEGRDPLPSLADAWDAPPPKPVLWRDPGPGAKDYGEALIGAGEVGILSGPGGAGKSTIAIALARAARPEDCPDGFGAACGLRIRSGPVAILSYEDSAPRLAGRAKWFGAREVFAHVFRAQDAAPLWTADPEDRRESGPSTYWRRWWDAVGKAEASLALIDPASVAFSGANPSDGAAVRAFLMEASSEAARVGCGVLIVAHDTKAARNEARDGQGPGPGAVSGSAQWSDGARAVLHLSGSGERRTLECVKANYCRMGWGATLRERAREGQDGPFRGWKLDRRLRDVAAEREERNGSSVSPGGGNASGYSPVEEARRVFGG